MDRLTMAPALDSDPDDEAVWEAETELSQYELAIAAYEAITTLAKVLVDLDGEKVVTIDADYCKTPECRGREFTLAFSSPVLDDDGAPVLMLEALSVGKQPAGAHERHCRWARV